MSSSTAVVILCGGVSRRLGVSKALMQVNGKPLFKVVEENLSPLGLPVYLVSKVPFESGGVPLILDIFEADTPLAGLLTALSTLQCQKLPVYSCGHAYTTKRSIAITFEACL